MTRFNFHLFASLIAAFALLVTLSGCTGTGEALENESSENSSENQETTLEKDPEEELVPVEAASIERGSIEAVLRFSTNLEAETEVQVFSEASRQVVELLVEEGDSVRQGQLLVRLKDDEQKSALAKAEIQYENAARELRRQKNLFEKELISEKAFNDATFEVEQLQISIDDAKRELSYTEVRAPISGVITQRMVNRGDTLTMNQHLFDIVDFESIVARVFVPEKEVPRLAVGQKARLFATPLGADGRVGRVMRIAPVVDSRSGTVKTTVAIPRIQGLRPGMFVEVELVTEVHPDALLIPKRAIVYDNDQAFLFRVVANDDRGDGDDLEVGSKAEFKAERVLIQAVLEDRDFVEPAAGVLEPGDRVVTAGQAGLKDGAGVRMLGEAAGEPAGDTEAEASAEEAA